MRGEGGVGGTGGGGVLNLPRMAAVGAQRNRKRSGSDGAHNLWLPDEASQSLHERVHHAVATKVRLRPVVLHSRLRSIVETQGGFVGQTSPLYLEFKSHELWRSLEPRGFEPLSRQARSMDFHGCPPKLLNKGFATETENDRKSWKLLDVTSIPRDLLPAGFPIFSNG